MRTSQAYYFRLIHKFMGKSFDRSKALELLSFIWLLAGAALVLLPLAAVFFVSVSPSGVGVKATGLTLANYQEAWRRGNFLLAFLNSTLVAIAVTGFQVVTSAFGRLCFGEAEVSRAAGPSFGGFGDAGNSVSAFGDSDFLGVEVGPFAEYLRGADFADGG